MNVYTISFSVTLGWFGWPKFKRLPDIGDEWKRYIASAGPINFSWSFAKEGCE